MCTQEEQVTFVVTSFHNTTTTCTTAQLWGDGAGHEHTVLSADEGAARYLNEGSIYRARVQLVVQLVSAPAGT